MRLPSSTSPFEAVSRLGRMLTQEVPLEAWLDEAARLAAACTGAAAGLVLERLAGGLFAVRGSAGWAVPLPRQPVALEGASHLQEALAAADGLVVRDLGSRPAEPDWLRAAGWSAAAVVSVAGATAPAGVLAVYAAEASALSADALPALRALAAVTAVAMVHDRTRAELHGERDERLRLAALVEGTDDAIVSATPEGRILSWNRGAERLYGYQAQEIVGQDVSRLVPADREADRHLLLERVRAGQRIPAFDAVHRRKDGSPVTVSLSLSPVHDQGGGVVAVAAVAHDVTRTRRMESDVRQSAKMEAVGRLAGGVAHDFNNMLTVIDGYSQLVLMKLAGDSPIRDLVEEIHRAGARAAELTRQLMVFSRKTMAEPEVLNLSETVQASVEMLTRIIGDDITITTRLEPRLDHVMVDRSQLEQVLVNLVLNARDAMPEGGRVTIQTANVTFESAHGVPSREAPPGQYVLLSVSDTGIGMDAATLKRVFEPFFTTKGSGRGTGLGLAMLHNFVMQSGGHVTVYSEPEQGSTFRIYLPTVALPLAPRAADAAAEAPSGTETILVVEDDPAVRQFTEAVLRAAGYDVLTAADGTDALAQARARERPIHLLMTDVVMPGLGGQALADQFRAAHPEARVLFASGFTPEAVSRRGMAIPAARFIQKPYSPAALCRRVRTALDE